MNYELNQISRFCNISCVLYSSIVEKVGRIDMTVDSIGVCIIGISVIILFLKKGNIHFMNLYHLS